MGGEGALLTCSALSNRRQRDQQHQQLWPREMQQAGRVPAGEQECPQDHHVQHHHHNEQHRQPEQHPQEALVGVADVGAHCVVFYGSQPADSCRPGNIGITSSGETSAGDDKALPRQHAWECSVAVAVVVCAVGVLQVTTGAVS